MMTETLIVAAAAAIAGAVIAWLATRSSYRRSLKYMKESSAANEESLKAAHRQALEDLRRSNAENLKLQADAVRGEMAAATEKLLKARKDELEKENKSSMDEILSPLRESIVRMEKAMKDNADEHLKNTTELRTSMEKAVRDMQERTADIGVKADDLSVALTGRPKVQGCFGENYLDDILIREGLVKGVHYTREEANSDLSRPDFVFHFKDGFEDRDLVVDSKVSLTAFVGWMNEPEGTPRKKELMEAHIRSIRSHIDELAKADYAHKISKEKRFADYVLMFMPRDMAYRVAMDNAPMLWKEAYDKGVLIATEQTIIPFLKIIQLTWNKFHEDSNHKTIMEEASAMVERVGMFCDSYRELGRKLKTVCKEYNDGIVKIQDDGRSITTSARNVMKLGAKRAKGKEFTIPEDKVFLSPGDEEL